ncbi:MAG: hypothetical protein ACYT04_47735 [Nostoc sp.]
MITGNPTLAAQTLLLQLWRAIACILKEWQNAAKLLNRREFQIQRRPNPLSLVSRIKENTNPTSTYDQNYRRHLSGWADLL